MSYTWNIFKDKIKGLSIQDKQKMIDELHLELMTARTRESMAPTKNNRIHLIRKQIAVLKTSMNVTGYHYHPRG